MVPDRDGHQFLAGGTFEREGAGLGIWVRFVHPKSLTDSGSATQSLVEHPTNACPRKWKHHEAAKRHVQSREHLR
jgi:hypothetical protein